LTIVRRATALLGTLSDNLYLGRVREMLATLESGMDLQRCTVEQSRAARARES
jgi:hypothetical protein